MRKKIKEELLYLVLSAKNENIKANTFTSLIVDFINKYYTIKNSEKLSHKEIKEQMNTLVYKLTPSLEEYSVDEIQDKLMSLIKKI